MAETYSAAGDDVQSLAWNPAGLASIQGREFTFMHAEWFEGVRYESLAYAQPVGNFIVVGGGVDFLLSGTIDRTTFLDPDAGAREGPENFAFTVGDTFTANNFVVTGAAAIDISGMRWITVPNVKAGINIRMLMQAIDKDSLSSAVIDIGGMWSPLFAPKLTVALVGQNVGPTMDGKLPPVNLRLGASYRMLKDALLLASDYYQPVDNYGRLSLGAEYWYRKLICVRGGYKFQGKIDLNDYETHGLEGIALGAGFRYQIVTVDYAFASLGFLGATHRVSLTVRF
jgi:hypothetical protein